MAASAAAAVTSGAAAALAPIADSPQRAAQVQDGAVAALYSAREPNWLRTWPAVRVRPAFRPAAAADFLPNKSSELLLDIALFDDTTDAAQTIPLSARPALNDDGELDVAASARKERAMIAQGEALGRLRIISLKP
jgi:hypothetical protein